MMLEFLKKRLLELQAELELLYKMRSNASVEAIGGYENRMIMVQQELKRLAAEIQKLEPTSQKSNEYPLSKPDQKAAIGKKAVYNFVAKAQLKDALTALKADFPNENDIEQVMGRLATLEGNRILGILSNQDDKLDRNQISLSILLLIEKLYG